MFVKCYIGVFRIKQDFHISSHLFIRKALEISAVLFKMTPKEIVFKCVCEVIYVRRDFSVCIIRCGNAFVS